MTFDIKMHSRSLMILFFLALGVNFAFLYYHNPYYYYTMTQLHGQVGYNLNHYHSAHLNPKLTAYMDQQKADSKLLVDYDQVDPTHFDAPSQPFIINDTIGYGVVLGLLWKLTGSFKFIDIQLLQIFIFSLMMIPLYHVAYLLFKDPRIAFLCCIAQLFYFPIIAMNVQPVRDIWAYYGIVLLLYGMVAYIFERRSWWFLMLCAIGFSICQYIRPSVFFALLTISFVMLCYGLAYRAQLKRTIGMLAMVALTNACCFWMPFFAYNQTYYNRYFVGPVGQDLLEGLGEFPNPWGYKLSDEWFANYITQKYGLISGTPEFDEKGQQEFKEIYKNNPSIFYINILKRIPGIITPGLPWIYYTISPYGDGLSAREKLTVALSSWKMFLDFIARHVYIRIFLILGYIGMLLALWRRRYFAVALLMIGVVCGGLGKLPSHIEYRYIVPYYFAFSFFVGYLIHALIAYIKKASKN